MKKMMCLSKFLVPFAAALLVSGAYSAEHAHTQQQPGAADHGAHQMLKSEVLVPGDSLFRIKAPLTDQEGRPFVLSQTHKTASVVTMFYGDCQLACPIILENVKQTVAALDEQAQKKLQVVLISLNPKADTPQKLKALMQSKGLESGVFTFVVAKNDADTRLWASAVGIKYRHAANGEINHSNRQVLLDATGSVIADATQLAVVPEADFLQKIKQTVR